MRDASVAERGDSVAVEKTSKSGMTGRTTARPQYAQGIGRSAYNRAAAKPTNAWV